MTAKAHLLVIDDDPNTLASLSRAFRLAGYEATVADNAGRALDLVRGGHFDLILSDVVMPGKDGLSFLEDLKRDGVATPVIMISGQANIEMAVRATRLGALDFLEKPLSTEKLIVTVENALRLTRLEQENRDLRQRLGKHELVWSGAVMDRLIKQIERVAASETRVCIVGETGTGKELVARALHERSPRHAGPFVTLNCAAVPAELIESELFGHEKGAFTGATGRHVGKFEQAGGGTLFLDEIGDMPLPMQAKLLRVLEEGEVERVGGDRPIAVDARVVVATHRNLEEMVAAERVSPGFIPQNLRFPDRVAAAARAPRRYSLARAAFLAPGLRAKWLEGENVLRERARRTRALRLARQRPRIAQRSRAPPAHRRGRRNHGGRRAPGPPVEQRRRRGEEPGSPHHKAFPQRLPR